MNENTQTLCPAQLACFERACRLASKGNIVAIGGASGSGKSTVLRHLARHTKGELLTMRQFMEWHRDAGDPLRLEETLEWLLGHHLAQGDTVLFDDLDRLLAVMRSDGYPRRGYIDAALAEMPRIIQAEERLLILSCTAPLPGPIHHALRSDIPEFGEADYRHLLSAFGGGSIDAATVFARYPCLCGNKLRAVAQELRALNNVTTDGALELLGANA